MAASYRSGGQDMKLTDFAIEVECPNCGQVTVTREDFVQGSYDGDGLVQIVFKCPSCEARVRLESKVDSSATDALTALAVSSSEIIAMTDTAIRGSNRIVVETAASPVSDGAVDADLGEEVWTEPGGELAVGGEDLGNPADEEHGAASNDKTADLSACVDAVSEGRHTAVSGGRLGESDLEDIDIEEPESIARIVRSMEEPAESDQRTLSVDSEDIVSVESSERGLHNAGAGSDEVGPVADEPVGAVSAGTEAADTEAASKDSESAAGIADGTAADACVADESAKSGDAAGSRKSFGSEGIGGCPAADAVDGAEIDEPADYRSVESAGAGNGDETSATTGAGSDDGTGESTGAASDVEAGKPARTDDAGEAAASAGTARTDGEQGSSEEEEPRGAQQQGKPAKNRLNIRYTVLGGNSMASFGVEIGRKSRTGKQQPKPQAEYTPTDEDLARLEYFHRQLESLDTVDEAIDEIDSGYNFSDADENEDDDKDE